MAPRRVGKTSLAIRLCEQWKSHPKRKSIYLNIKGRSDELAFAEKLIGELARTGLHPDAMTRALGVFTKIRKSLGGKVGVPGIEVSLGEAAEADHSTLGKVLESVFRKIEETILGCLCQHRDEREREHILAVLMSKPSADVDKVEEQLGRLLVVLQRDGYLLENLNHCEFNTTTLLKISSI